MNGYSIDTSSTTGCANREAIMMNLKYNQGITPNFYYKNFKEASNEGNTKKSNIIKGLIALLISKF